MKRFFGWMGWGLFGLLVACGGTAAPEPAAPLPTQEVMGGEDVPTAEPSPLPLPTPTPAPQPSPSPAANVPDGVWLAYGTGSYGNPVAVLRKREMGYEPEPAAIEIFFDYSPINGQLAFGGEFWSTAGDTSDAVTDLVVYDYGMESAVEWLAGGVGRAMWSPVAGADGRAPLAVALHNGQGYDLALLTGPNEVQILANDIDPYWTWSPDGQQMAFVRDGHLVTAALPIAGEVETVWATDVYGNSGWVGDAPVWDDVHNLLIYADNPFTIVDMNTAEVIRPTLPADLEPNRPKMLLWAAGLRQLIVQEEGMTGNTLRVYQLADDWRSVTASYTAPNTELLGWYTAGESLWVRDELSGELRIRPLTE
jgi:hypothetical protein